MEVYIKGNKLKLLRLAMKKAPKMINNELSLAINEVVHNVIRPIMQRQAPMKTGKLRSNIYAKSFGLGGIVGPNLEVTPYARWVNNGSSAYVIRPKTKKALYWDGAEHPYKLVHHPGIKANPFVERTFEEMQKPVKLVFDKSVKKIIKNILHQHV